MSVGAAASVFRTIVIVLAATALWAPSAGAQTSREEQIVSEQAEKATRLHPYQPTRIENWIRRAERSMLAAPVGFYPWLGSVYPGGLFAVGPGFRMPYGRRGVFDAQAALSFRNYKLLRATLSLPPVADGRVRATFSGQFIDAPNVSFYGVGNETRKADRTFLHQRPAEVGAALAVAPARHLEFGGSLKYLDMATDRGRGGPSVETRFTPETAPGLGSSPTYVVSGAYASYDWRDSPGYSRRGGFYRAGWSSFDERSGAPLSFQRVDLEAIQLIPLLRENWIIALRGTVSTTSADAGESPPFFLMPQLGGGSDLRGYPVWRFRDRNRILVGAEYRWTPAHFIDMAIFTDAGKVTADRSDLNLRNLKRNAGIGIRFHTATATFLRLELARSAERLTLVMAFGQIY